MKTSKQRIEAGETDIIRVTQTFKREFYVKVPKDLPFDHSSLTQLSRIEDEANDGLNTECMDDIDVTQVESIPRGCQEIKLDDVDLEELDEWVSDDMPYASTPDSCLKAWDYTGDE